MGDNRSTSLEQEKKERVVGSLVLFQVICSLGFVGALVARVPHHIDVVNISFVLFQATRSLGFVVTDVASVPHC